MKKFERELLAAMSGGRQMVHVIPPMEGSSEFVVTLIDPPFDAGGKVVLGQGATLADAWKARRHVSGG